MAQRKAQQAESSRHCGYIRPVCAICLLALGLPNPVIPILTIGPSNGRMANRFRRICVFDYTLESILQNHISLSCSFAGSLFSCPTTMASTLWSRRNVIAVDSWAQSDHRANGREFEGEPARGPGSSGGDDASTRVSIGAKDHPRMLILREALFQCFSSTYTTASAPASQPSIRALL